MRAGVAWLVVLVLAGCGTLEHERPGARTSDLPRRPEVAGVPFHSQTPYHCGPAALATVLGWAGAAVAPEQLIGAVFTPERQGTFQHDVLAGARRHGRLAVPVRSTPDLLAEIAAGHPVLVLQNLALDWYPRWHYAVAVGYDLDAGTIALRSGTERRRVISLANFERTWRRSDRWALVVLPPDRLPATPGPEAVLEAAAGLERAGQPRAAAAAFAAALARWPASLAARIGLANARYVLGDTAGAEHALRAAVLLHPDAGAAWNNLAHVLLEHGRPAKAVAAASRAVELGGAHAAAARQTLNEALAARDAAS